MCRLEVSIIIVYDLGSISEWLTSIGTIGAVIVALYLSKKDEKPRAKVKSTVSYVVGMEMNLPRTPIYISLEIVNTGKIPIHLAECTIQMSRFTKKRMTFLDGSHNVKRLLNPGEFYEHKLDYEPIYNYLAQSRIRKLKTYMYFSDSLGNVYKTIIILRN